MSNGKAADPPSRTTKHILRQPRQQTSSLESFSCNGVICAIELKFLRRGSFYKPAPSFLQKDIKKGIVNPNLAVIFDEPQFSKTIHEEAHPRPGGANHLR